MQAVRSSAKQHGKASCEQRTVLMLQWDPQLQVYTLVLHYTASSTTDMPLTNNALLMMQAHAAATSSEVQLMLERLPPVFLSLK
jgi:hypothetical protein